MSGDDSRRSFFDLIERAEKKVIAGLASRVKVYSRVELEAFAKERGVGVSQNPITENLIPTPPRSWKGGRKRKVKVEDGQNE